MSKLTPIPPVPEVSSVFALLDFLRDPKAVAERLGKLEGLRKDINAKIELVGRAEEIQSLRAQAATDRQAAAGELQAAHEAAAKRVEDAKASAGDILGKARDEAEKLVSDARDRLRSVEQRAEGLAAREVAAMRREDLAKKLAADAQALHDTGSKLKQEFEAKLAKLKAAGVA